MTDYGKKLEEKFKKMNVQERLKFLCDLRAQEKALESFRKEKYKWVLEQSDSDLKECGVWYRVFPEIKKISEKKFREQEPDLYLKVLDKYGAVQPERIDVILKGVKK